MEVATSARKHGITDADIRHGVVNAIRSVDQADRVFLIGPALDGELLEIVVLDPEDDPVVIHAMRLRSKFHDHLR